VRSAGLWARLLDVERAVVEQVAFDDDADAIVVAVRPRKATKRRCGKCGRRYPGFDQDQGRRRWRALDLGTVRAYLEADGPRAACSPMGWWPRCWPTSPGAMACSRRVSCSLDAPAGLEASSIRHGRWIGTTVGLTNVVPTVVSIDTP
jgi:transposase